ncbi:Glycosyltransferase involved in cell wall bisynthesis [Algoriphagus locisalis]|uniref:Glycosyltransferase involved in cell wall bisynthesis n=1 Tax=Algoriphagus locisalis TaxID=305507 RepID=A0A1I6XTP2_9BACT|nr:glycosyltransferase family A protein [Algoriphagus locisalis]SFT41895.1 Glycosyltransferase involved in cell wall bisynthesis [Algoriphagus locisalis]
MKPLVSIIIPVYNKAAFVIETLDSALGQSYPNIELILVNDGSTDGSMAILETYQSNFPDKINLINQPNGGVSKATNVGIQASKGEYIQFLDADDILSPDKIFQQIKLLENKDSKVMASCEWVNFKEDIVEFSSPPYGVFKDFESGLDLQLRFWNNQEMMAISSYLTHRKLIEKTEPWDENLTINQDGEFFMRVLLQASKVLFEPTERVYYRQPGLSNVSQQKSEKAYTSLLDSYKAYERNVLSAEDSHRVRKALKKVYQKFIYDCFPNYPHLVAKAEVLMKALNVSEKTFIGGPKFQQLSRLIGFKNALLLKRLLK